ncbi:hypothetical protein FA04_10140 [Ensifer adhaerens]|nr:hypothetical protein FA04_10140 [Ensifer adhaerens]KDP75206.1 hypothetical protein FA04_03110 [Ensifer adhaerens]KQX32674.1 hypothetical protein ASD01_01630 [Ensifer sp. Root423]KQZ58244.1 hypothetical protein ASD63_01640 [Ensifer sp. Root558]
MRRAAIVLPLFEICGFNLTRSALPAPALKLAKQGIGGDNARLEPADQKDGGKTEAFLVIKVDMLVKARAPQHAVEHGKVRGNQWMLLCG